MRKINWESKRMWALPDRLSVNVNTKNENALQFSVLTKSPFELSGATARREIMYENLLWELFIIRSIFASEDILPPLFPEKIDTGSSTMRRQRLNSLRDQPPFSFPYLSTPRPSPSPSAAVDFRARHFSAPSAAPWDIRYHRPCVTWRDWHVFGESLLLNFVLWNIRRRRTFNRYYFTISYHLSYDDSLFVCVCVCRGGRALFCFARTINNGWRRRRRDCCHSLLCTTHTLPVLRVCD